MEESLEVAFVPCFTERKKEPCSDLTRNIPSHLGHLNTLSSVVWGRFRKCGLVGGDMSLEAALGVKDLCCSQFSFHFLLVI